MFSATVYCTVHFVLGTYRRYMYNFNGSIPAITHYKSHIFVQNVFIQKYSILTKNVATFFLIIINKMVLQYHCDNKSNLIEKLNQNISKLL